MTMEGYVEYCKRMRSATPPPRPRTPPVPMGHPEYHRFIDERRVTYLRFLQHERIGSLITKEESEDILERKEAFLSDRKLLQAIADRTGVYIDLEVKDCIQQFLKLRQDGERMHRAVTEFDKKLPKTLEDQKAIINFMKGTEVEEERQKALALRDSEACPLRHNQSWTGAGAICELTKLRYWECCGSLAAQPKTGPPRYHRDPDTPEWKAIVERETEREANSKFKGMAKHSLRKAYVTSRPPKFRKDY
ncbi:hypothetical protein GPECTOR_8g234 [Gonium pectorale]|uniref:Uncharacterized protein n=1 Tax=Gonium pectorale TaxID=33097 RepID=A0A150GT05_GONPE|nr:hypothetical protein GPECTOR_8g234 [Gonium pectorale]|eukprot:KXZ52852.1 hypothetical protein GPECTOR_8g234 [Gonium pectorale]